MSKNLVINGVTYNGIESMEIPNTDGEKIVFIPEDEAGVDLPELANPAGEGDVLIGKEFINQDGDKAYGMVQQRAWTHDYNTDVPLKVVRDSGDYLFAVEDGTNFGDATTDDVVNGKTFTSKHGSQMVGTATLQEDLASELSTQDTLIANIMTALEGKAAGGGSGGKAIVFVESFETAAYLFTPSGCFTINRYNSTGWSEEYELDVGAVCVLFAQEGYYSGPYGVEAGYEDTVLYTCEGYEGDDYSWNPGVLMFRVGENGTRCWVGYH